MKDRIQIYCITLFVLCNIRSESRGCERQLKEEKRLPGAAGPVVSVQLLSSDGRQQGNVYLEGVSARRKEECAKRLLDIASSKWMRHKSMLRP